MPIDNEVFSRQYHVDRAIDPMAVWDFVVIGGGATGAGIALDASMRGYSVLLLESHDFGKGTSSRSTKLIHGGVRYLEQFQFSMVRDSLRERGLLLKSAPHVVHELEFVIPCHRFFDRLYYGAGLKLYDLLAIGSKASRSRQVPKGKLYQMFPTLVPDKFAGGVSYSDAQFDDSRLLIDVVRLAAANRAVVLNHAPVIEVVKDRNGQVRGVRFQLNDNANHLQNGLQGVHEVEVRAKCVINATGPFCDMIRRLDDPQAESLVAASQGIHLVLPRRFFPSESAMIVPKTSDGRVLFVIPWLGHVVVGTTDTPIPRVTEEPRPMGSEIEFLLDTVRGYLQVAPNISDCLSVFTGIRPLVKKASNQPTSRLSRDHTIDVSRSGLVTITGGKWTTFRKMGEDCVDQAARLAGLEFRESQTHRMSISNSLCDLNSHSLLDVAGASEVISESLQITKQQLHAGVRYEFATCVEDLLARRTRALFLNASEAMNLSSKAASILAEEHGWDHTWQVNETRRFCDLAMSYLPSSYGVNQSVNGDKE